MIAVSCPSCSKRLRCPDEKIGHAAKCPHCGATWTILPNLPSEQPHSAMAQETDGNTPAISHVPDTDWRASWRPSAGWADTAPAAQPVRQGKLVNCPDCGRQISRLAPNCPGCGRPMNQMGTAQVQPTTLIEQTSKRFKKQQVIGFVIWLPGAMLVVIGLGGLGRSWPILLSILILCFGGLASVIGLGVAIRAGVLSWWHHG